MRAPNDAGSNPVITAALLTALLITPLLLEATPTQINGNKGTTQFPDGTLITVYIPVDPTGGGREASLKAGILAWNSERPLLNHNIQIQVKPGQAPAGAANSVQVNWAAPANGTELGEAVIKGTTKPSGNTTTGGTINIDPDTTDVDDTEAQNLGIHEMGHILGLADSPFSGNAMDPAFDRSKKISIKDEDTLELFATFAASNSPSSAHASVTVTPNGALYDYHYQLTWLSGISLALFQVDTNGADLQGLVVPAGWAFDGGNGADVSFVNDGEPRTEQFASFVARDESQLLGPDQPQLEFAFESSRAPGTVQAFLSGRFDTPGPVAVPEPGSLGLLGGLLAGALLTLIRRRPESVRYIGYN